MKETYKAAIAKLVTIIDLTEKNLKSRNESDKREIIDITSSLLRNLEEEFCFDKFENSTENFTKLVKSLYEKVMQLNEPQSYNKDTYFLVIGDLLEEIIRINQMETLSDIDNTIVLVGGNGSGKSSFINYIKESKLGNLFVIPAQKYLFFSERNHRRDIETIETYRETTLKTNFIAIGKQEEQAHVLERVFTYPFTFLMTALVKDYANVLVQKKRKEIELEERPIWDELEEIWEQVFPDIQFKLDSNNRKVSIMKQDSTYSINGLSDGEKCVLFYIGNVLIAPSKSYIVVDEPETFLNPTIFNKLWDLLIQHRSDCQFIFASHNIDFISARENCSFVWNKEFTYPDKFKLKLIDSPMEFPTVLLTELVGSKKPILFCEGTYNSLDYQIYSKLFSKNYYVRPVGGHLNVVSYTESFNSISSFHGNSASGIIDGDYRSEETRIKLEAKHILILPFNEIEMFLLSGEIIEAVLGTFNSKLEILEIFQTFQIKLKELLQEKKDTMVLAQTKLEVDVLIKGSLINKYESINSIQNEVDCISSNIDVDKIYKEIDNKFIKVLKEDEYNELIKICNLKGKVLNGLGNKLLFVNYKNHALKKISNDESLQVALRYNYFCNLTAEKQNLL